MQAIGECTTLGRSAEVPLQGACSSPEPWEPRTDESIRQAEDALPERRREGNIAQTMASPNIPEGQPNPARKGGRNYTYAFVVCKCGKPLMPTNPAKARHLLKQGKAKVFRLNPFTIQLNYETPHATQPMEIRFDYGAKVHGVALVQECETHNRAVFLGEAEQRQDVKKRMDERREYRRNRRNRKTRYRKPRFNNRRRPKGWTPPTIRQRVESIVRITRALLRIAPINRAVVEVGQFDTQKLINPKIEGVGYQQGPGLGYESKRHAVLVYFNYTCQYCGAKRGVMTVDHVIPKARGGTDAWSNLTCACKNCNDEKGDRTPKDAGMRYPKTVTSRNPGFLKFCSLMQSGKNYLITELQKLIPLQTVFGWETKRNRESVGLPKTHYFDALFTRLDDKPLLLTTAIYRIHLRKRNTRRTHLSNPKAGIRQQYNAHRVLAGFRKGDLISTPHGQAYVNAIRSSGYLQFDVGNHRYALKPTSVKLLEHTKPVQFNPIPLPAEAGSFLGGSL